MLHLATIQAQLAAQHSVLQLYKRLVYLRTTMVSLRQGPAYFPYHDKEVFAFLR
jgi:hypothetical protein